MTISILQDYIQRIRHLIRSPRGNNRYAPHKPFLLLAIIELIKQSEIEENIIPFSDSLITLFTKYISLTPVSEEWGEPIPRINAFLFYKNGTCTDYICKNIFGCDDGQQPTPLQIAGLAKKIETYEKWDQVIETFRKDAFGE